MKNSRCLVVGGGIVGLLAAYLASKQYEVVLLEKSESLGGLLNSFEQNGAVYDYGTHVPTLTGIGPLDEILFGEELNRSDNYFSFPYLKSENYFLGRQNETSSLIDARSIAKDKYNAGLAQLLEAPGAEDSERQLYAHLIATFGEVFTEEIFRPVLKKLVNAELESLDKDILNVFGLHRLIVLNESTSKELKAIPKFDSKIAFHSYKDGLPSVSFCYPKGNCGVGAWMQALIKQVESAGVEIITNNFVSKIEHSDAVIKSATLSNGKTIECDQVLWAIPPALALKASGIKYEGSAPAFRTHTLCHFEFEKPLLNTTAQYVMCWDPTMSTYRVTLYPNITEDRSKLKKYNLTVEVLSDSSAKTRLDDIEKTALEELYQMSIVAPNNKVISAKVDYLGNSFPVITKEFQDSSAKILALTVGNLKNITVLGRSATAKFSIHDLMVETFHKVSSLNSHSHT